MQLNYEIMRDNVLAEIQDPQEKRRQRQVIKSYHIVRDPSTNWSMRNAWWTLLRLKRIRMDIGAVDRLETRFVHIVNRFALVRTLGHFSCK